MKRIKNIMPILMVLMLIVGISSNVYAASGTITYGGTAGNIFEATGKGPKTDHTSCTYAIDNQPAWCIDAGVDVVQGEGYECTRDHADGGALSWLMYHSHQMGGPIDNQIIQAAVWSLTGNIVTNVSGNQAFSDQVASVIEQASHCNDNLQVANAEIHVANGDYSVRYDRSRNAYVSSKITVSNGTSDLQNAPMGSWLENFEDGVRIVVPAELVSGDTSMTIVANCTSSGEGYGPAKVWTKAGSQTLVTPSKMTVSGQGTSATFNLTAVGDLKVLKNDEHGKAISETQFRVTGGPDNINTIITTNKDGVAELREIRVGDYTITEVSVPGNLYISQNTQNVSYHVNSGYTNTITFQALNSYKRGSTQLSKSDLYYAKNPKGDCKLGGAKYGVFAATDIYEGETLVFSADEQLTEVVTDANGDTPVVKEVYCSKLGKWLSGIPVGSYYWKELEPSVGYLLNEEKVNFEIVNNKDLYTFDLDKVDVTQNEKPILGRIQVIKYDNDNSNEDEENNTEKSPAAGAVLKVTLVSAKGTDQEARNTYTAVVDDKGYAEFVNEDLREECYPYTIPYGKYELTEVSTSEYGQTHYFFIDPEEVDVYRNEEDEKRIVADEPVPMYLKIVKRDKDTKEEVHLAGAQYKIWDCKAERFVVQNESPSWEEKDIFTTNDEGYVYTYQKLYAGDYIVYEVTAPKGYYLDDEYRLPENEADWGDETKGGVKIHIDKHALGIIESSSPSSTKPDLVYVLDMYNSPLKAQLEVEKKGEKITGVTTANVSYKTTGDNTEELEKYIATYSFVGLPGVTYEIYAVNDIKSPDGRITYVPANKREDTITTDENGYAITKELYPGEYRIVETVTPVGYIVDENIPNVTLTSTDSLKRVEIHNKELSDIRQKLGLTFEKIFEEVNYSNSETVEERAVFGVYTKENILTYTGNVAIGKDKLVDLIEVDEDGDVTSYIDLPQGTYYVKELYASYPYTASTEEVDYTLNYNGNSKQEFVVVSGDEFTNTYDSASITLIKLSTATVDNVILNGDQIDTSELDETVQEILNTIKGMTETEIKDYFEENNVKFVAGATYRVYTDEECKNALRIKNEKTGIFELAELVTNESGLIKLENVPLGHYYVKEVEAPQGYELSDEVIEIDLDIESKNTMLYQALMETLIVKPMISKIDIFTSEVVPNCVFEIADEEGNVLLHSTTDDRGMAFIPVVMFEDGKTYTYTEIKAPDIYDIDTTPHEFTAKIDEEGNWVTDLIEVSNLRKVTDLPLKKLDMFDSTPIPNCKFELKSLETDWKVEGVTDENGEYVFKDVPYGKYTYTELEAPEEYLIDTTPHEITIDSNDMKIVVYNELKPDTGDIAVVALVIVAVVCVLGVVFVIVKNKKSSK